MDKEYHKMQLYAFKPETGPDFDYKLEAPWIGEKRGMVSGKKPLAVGCFKPTQCSIRGEWKPIGCINDIATPPEYRRQGLVKKLLFYMLTELKDRGIYLSALWAASFPLYRKFGFGLVTELTHYSLPLGLLNFTRKVDPGNFREFSDDDFPATDALYQQFVQNYNLPLQRTQNWWDAFILKQTQLSSGTPAYSYVLEEKGAIKGYLLFTLENKPSGGRKLQVRELVYTDDSHYLQLLQFLFNHAIQAEEVELYASLDILFFDRISEPENVRKFITPGAMVRLVDVTQALENLRANPELSGEITITVWDPFLEWNEGNYLLEINRGEITLQKNKKIKPEAELDINTLAQLYTGYLPPQTAIRLGRLEVHSPEKLDLLNQIFPRYRTLLKDYF